MLHLLFFVAESLSSALVGYIGEFSHHAQATRTGLRIRPARQPAACTPRRSKPWPPLEQHSGILANFLIHNVVPTANTGASFNLTESSL